MSNHRRRVPERNAGAFLGPDILIAVPMRTLDREYADEPAEPPEDREPEAEQPGRVRRALDRIVKRPSPPEGEPDDR